MSMFFKFDLLFCAYFSMFGMILTGPMKIAASFNFIHIESHLITPNV